jgi:hypothetical protein
MNNIGRCTRQAAGHVGGEAGAKRSRQNRARCCSHMKRDCSPLLPNVVVLRDWRIYIGAYNCNSIPEGQLPMDTDSHIGADQGVYRYLVALEFSEEEIAEMSMNTRFSHDLGFYGDTAEDLIRFSRGRLALTCHNSVSTDTFHQSSREGTGSKLSFAILLLPSNHD